MGKVLEFKPKSKVSERQEAYHDFTETMRQNEIRKKKMEQERINANKMIIRSKTQKGE